MGDLDHRFWDCWYQTLVQEIWWYDISEEFAAHLLRNTIRAHKSKYEYFFQGLENIELTKIYDQCKLVSILAKDHNDEKTIP